MAGILDLLMPPMTPDDERKQKLAVNAPRALGPLASLSPIGKPDVAPAPQPTQPLSEVPPAGGLPPIAPVQPTPLSTFMSQNPAPQLHGWKRALDVAGQIAAPNIESHIPGTPGSYQRGLAGATEQTKEQAGIGETAARTDLARAEAEKDRRLPVDKPDPWKTLSPGEDLVDPETGQRISGPSKPAPTPTEGYQRATIEDPKNPGKSLDVLFDPARNSATRGQYLDPATMQPIPGARAYERPEKPDKPSETDESISDYLAANKLPNTPTNRDKARQELGSRKATAASDKGVQESLSYASDYQKSQHTGPGDEALMEQFFNLAKPSSGFRMNQAQMNMLQSSRSWMDSVEGRAYHASKGVWFDDNQRDQIIQTMQALARSKGQAVPGTSGSQSVGGLTIKRDANGRIIGVE